MFKALPIFVRWGSGMGTAGSVPSRLPVNKHRILKSNSSSG
jgi:hypothetical protein